MFDRMTSMHQKSFSIHTKEDNEELLGPEVPYHSVISTLMYLANYI